MGEFTRVSLDEDIRADADGAPVIRECHDHEIMMSFFDDEGACAFREWWDDVGAEQFYDWLVQSEEFKYQCKWQ